MVAAPSFAAEMLTVPGQAACSCEQETVIGGSRSTGWTAAIRAAMAQATTVSVVSGRYAPCCSKLPIGSTATDGRPALTSSVVAAGSSPPATASVPGRLIFLPFLALRWGFPGVDRMRGRPRRGVPPAPTAAAYAGGRRAVPKGPLGDVGRRISLFPAQYGSSAARVGA